MNESFRGMFHRHTFALGFAICASATAQAQGFNVDIGDPGLPIPSDAYGAAPGQAGRWNGVGDPWSAVLFNLNGTPSGVTLSSPGPGPGGLGEFSSDNTGTTGGDEALYDDLMDLGDPPDTTSFTFSGLADGDYEVYTYAWAPDDSTFQTDISVQGSPDGVETCGGLWPGAHSQGTTYALHTVTVSGGADLVVDFAAATGFGSANGIQVVRIDGGLGQNYCTGAANSAGPGATISATGSLVATDQNVTLSATGCPDNIPGLFYFGPNQVNQVFGDGFRCVSGGGGTVKRIYPFAFSGPMNGNPAGFADRVLDFAAGYGASIVAGADLNFQFWYRDNAAMMSGFNLSDGYNIVFQ